MQKKIYELSPDQYIRIVTKSMLAGLDTQESPTDRLEKVPGVVLAKMRETGVFSCGAGGLFADQGIGLVRKGYGRIGCADMDFFTPSNYSRQLCFADDLYRNKAVAAAKNLAREAILETIIEGFAMPYQDARHYIDWTKYGVRLCNVDNDSARVDLSIDARMAGQPAIFSAVSKDAGNGYVFVQESRPDTPCFGCVFPKSVTNKRQPCPGTPACRDILTAVAGLVLYAIDSVIMPRKRFWNLRYVFLDGSIEDTAVTVKKNPDCPLCGAGAQK